MRVEFVYDTVARKPQIVSEYLNQIREHFSVEDKALVFMRRRTGRSNMPVRKYAITNKGHFDMPFFRVIYDAVLSKFPSLQIIINNNLEDRIKPYFIAHTPIKLKYEPRGYQLVSATKALQHGQGVIVLPTSAGKTLTIALIAATVVNRHNFKVLILVPNIQLVEQTYNDFIDYGIESGLISKWTGNHEYKTTNIVIANNQILLSKTQDVTVLDTFHVVICDECLRRNSLIKTNKGEIPIQDVKAGDLVYSFSGETNTIELQPVLNTWTNLQKSNGCNYFLEIELENGNVLQVTPNHKIYTKRGKVRAEELTLEDEVISFSTSNFMTFWYKYMYVKTTIQTYMLNLWNRRNK